MIRTRSDAPGRGWSRSLLFATAALAAVTAFSGRTSQHQSISFTVATAT